MFRSSRTLTGLFFLFALAAPAFSAVVIDPGHGGFEHGITYTDPGSNRTVYEKNITLTLGKTVSRLLQERGISVSVTRGSDLYAGLSERVRDKNPSAFLGLHLSAKNSFNVYIPWMRDEEDPARRYAYSKRQRPHLKQSAKLGLAVEATIKEAFPGWTVSVMELPLAVLNETAGPAVVVETPHPSSFDYNDLPGREHLAGSLANAVAGFLANTGPVNTPAAEEGD